MRAPDGSAGCLLGGAIGDALGGPIEFLSIEHIRRQYGPEGITGFVALDRDGCAEFTDDTQMTLFTAEGLLFELKKHRPVLIPEAVEEIYHAYLRWLQTQSRAYPAGSQENLPSRLLREKGLWKQQAPGNTCLSALASGKAGRLDKLINNSKGCGGVMRAAPVGLVCEGEAAFELGCRSAALTHGHPSGYLPAGCLALMIAEVYAGKTLREAVAAASAALNAYPHNAETARVLEAALDLAGKKASSPSPETVETLGQGWVGEEALAMAVYCALIGEQEGSFSRGLLLAANHSGDCDSTAAIAGNLLGARMGRRAIPGEWLEKIALRPLLDELAAELQALAPGN